MAVLLALTAQRSAARWRRRHGARRGSGRSFPLLLRRSESKRVPNSGSSPDETLVQTLVAPKIEVQSLGPIKSSEGK
jgi:hypothetical protein